MEVIEDDNMSTVNNQEFSEEDLEEMQEQIYDEELDNEIDVDYMQENNIELNENEKIDENNTTYK